MNINMSSLLYLSFSLQDMVCNREAPLAGRSLGVLEAALSSQKSYNRDLCASLNLALLQVLQRLSMENDFDKGHTAQGMYETTHWGYSIRCVIFKSVEYEGYIQIQILFFIQDILWSVTQTVFDGFMHVQWGSDGLFYLMCLN